MMQETSLTAFEQVKKTLGKRQQLVYDTLLKLGCVTDMELARYLRMDARSVGPRRNELVKKGLVVECEKRQCTVTKKTAIAWRGVIEKA